MIPYTACQKCQQPVDATNTDAFGHKHPSEEGCSMWERFEEWHDARLSQWKEVCAKDRRKNGVGFDIGGEAGV